MSGLNSMLNSAMTGSTRLVCCEPFNAELCLDLLEKYKATKAFFLPMNLAAINSSPSKLKKSIKSLKVVFSTGAIMHPETLKDFKELVDPKCRFIQGFACTEKGLITLNFFGKCDGSCGVVAPNVEIKIIDENGNCVGPNVDGEIVTRNFLPWKGYYEDEEATKEVYDQETDWYKTCDLGHFNENGDLFIVDRIKEIIKSKEYHVSPTEIELHISKMKGILEVCVVGIPDPLTNNLPAALVVKAIDSEVLENDILKHVSERF